MKTLLCFLTGPHDVQTMVVHPSGGPVSPPGACCGGETMLVIQSGTDNTRGFSYYNGSQYSFRNTCSSFQHYRHL